MRADEPNVHDEAEPDPRWIELADRIATGEHIDWEALAAEMNDPAGQQILRNLRTLASIGQLHTSTDLDPDDSEPATTATPGTSSTARPSQGGSWGSLELIEEIGRGSFGTVWRARDPRLDREVALKLLHPSREFDDHDRSRFLEEGRALARLDHENVVRVFGAQEHEGRVGLWMEFVRGRSLADLVRDNGAFGAEEAALIGEKLARALAAVHTTGVVHRDVKAHNVMRAEGGRIVLMDFGAATPSAPDEAPRTVTGTPLYLAPELLEGQPADARSDLYGLGVLLYHLVTGAHPIVATHVAELRQHHRDGRRVSLADARPDLPAAFVRVVERALAPDPRDRFASAGEMAQALASIDGGATDVPSSPARPARPPRALWALAAVLAVAITAFTLMGRSSSPLQVEASLLRFGENTTEELYSGARLQVGDELGLRVRTNARSWVYVLNRDEQGRFHVMFPQPGVGLQNPLDGERAWDLPGEEDGEPLAWQVDTAGGEEQVLVLVSAERLEDIENRIGRADGGIAPRALEGLRGIGGLVRREGGGGADAGADLFAAIDELQAGRSTASEGIWTRRIVLRNP